MQEKIDNDQSNDPIFSDAKLNRKYNILEKIDQGEFNKIYKAINRATLSQVVLKVEFDDKAKLKKLLLKEIQILKELQGVDGVPKMFNSGQWQNGSFMEIEFFPSTLFKEVKKQFKEVEILSITLELLKILKGIHERGILHQNIQPQNIMRNKEGKLFLIDFGHSKFKKSKSQKNSSSQSKIKNYKFQNLSIFSPIVAHNFFSQSEQDEIQSLLYVIGFLMKKQTPWCNVKGKPMVRFQKIKKLKISKSYEWMLQCHNVLAKIYQYTTSKQSKTFNYESIFKIFNYPIKSATNYYETVKMEKKLQKGKSENICIQKKSPSFLNDFDKQQFLENILFVENSQSEYYWENLKLIQFQLHEESEEEMKNNFNQQITAMKGKKIRSLNFQNPFNNLV